MHFLSVWRRYKVFFECLLKLDYPMVCLSFMVAQTQPMFYNKK